MTGTVDAVVVGSGPNGLVAANLLADRGWDVVVVEQAAEPGGAVRSAEVTAPGFTNDLFSAFYPLGYASPVIDGLELGSHGLRWCRAPLALAPPTPDGPTAVIGPTVDETCASLEAFAPGTGEGWRRLYARWTSVAEPLLGALLSPLPPVRHGLELVRRLGPRGTAELARQGLLPVRRLAEEHHVGEGGALLLAGCALHADLTPETAGGALYGWLLASLAQQVGFPVPEGGAGALTAALGRRLAAAGGEVRCGAAVVGIELRDGRAAGVRLADGSVLGARRAVLADVGAPALYRDLVGLDRLPATVAADVGRFQYGVGTVKVDWALSGPVPWRSETARRAGTVHVADSLDQLTEHATALATHRLPPDPFLLVGQMTTADPTRSPAGTESAWAYTHVPQRLAPGPGVGPGGRLDREGSEAVADRMAARLEAYAPGFGRLVLARHVAGPDDLEAANPNLVGGATTGGTAQLHQQLVLRPTPGGGRSETPVPGLYLASASAHPGGGVHGACGSNAARAAVWHDRIRRTRRWR